VRHSIVSDQSSNRPISNTFRSPDNYFCSVRPANAYRKLRPPAVSDVAGKPLRSETKSDLDSHRSSLPGACAVKVSLDLLPDHIAPPGAATPEAVLQTPYHAEHSLLISLKSRSAPSAHPRYPCTPAPAG